MIVLDENIADDQRTQLRAWRIRTHKIGRDLAAKGIQDDQIVPLLLTLTRPTFFTRDIDFANRNLCHASYCLVYLGVKADDAAGFIRRVLRHPALNTRNKRMGSVVTASHVGIQIWRRNEAEQVLPWL
jgi:hypothetical protein